MNFIMAFTDYPFYGCAHHISHNLDCVRGGNSVIVKMAEAAKKPDGFECKFVQDPPKWLQTECPIIMFAYT